MVVGVGGQNYVRLRGVWFTSFYLSRLLLHQFNIPQDMPLALRNFSSKLKFVTPHVSLTLERLWRERLTWQFSHAQFGILRPLRPDIISWTWLTLEEMLAEDPYKMCWFQFMASRPTEINLVTAY